MHRASPIQNTKHKTSSMLRCELKEKPKDTMIPRLLLLLSVGLLLVAAQFAIINITARPSNLHRLCHSDSKTLCQDVVGNAQVEDEKPTTPLENLKRFSHDLYYYPPLSYGAPKDMCMWQAFLDNKIQSEECSAALKTRMASAIGLCIIAFAKVLIASYFCHLCLSKFSLSRLTPAVVFGSLLVSVIYIYESGPLVSTLDVGMFALDLTACIVQSISFAIMILPLMSTTDTPSGDNKEEDEVEKQWYEEDGYRKMGDGDETVLYVAVPLQAGTSLV